MKKIISIALALLMVAVMLPVMAMAEDVYTTLPTASNGEISLDKDVVLSAQVTINENVTINFNGHKIYNTATFDGYFISVQNGYTVTMKDGAIVDSRGNEKGTITTIRNLGTLTLENMTISRGVGIAVKNDEGASHYGKLTVTNCTITAGSNQIKGQAIQNWGEATIESGTFNADVNAWAYKGGHAGSTTINGGTFNCNVQSLQLNYVSTGWPTTSAQTNINGGTFNGNVATGYQVGDQPSDAVPAPEGDVTSANMGVAGGTFNSDVTEYAGDTLVVENNGAYYVGGTAKNAVENATSGTFTVKKAENGTSLTVKPGVTVKNESNGNLTVNGNEVAPEKSYTVPGTITIIVPSEGGSTTTTPSTDNTKNPGTGANDFVGVAAAMAVVSLLGAAAVIRKK